ncbi:exodeoxyribonuclease III [Phaeovibrio sulfidiphilus]|uniref:Exodeoxyribonuclease III n=1 Tax=Phaeovibrio sulfidiphilus TaxID=1220600 RepID=A0A8J6YNI0_9PROT|nr:exodeoxyribonuclease III [Phaeovibrio sulfidiphilus]MBE1237790.1 exodeoxyribonuclease III [Phaeovibrio sulfidiphilus]
MVRLATFNVNSIRARLPAVMAWLGREDLDVVLFQEIKVRDEEFPVGAFEDAGWQIVYHGQPSYNGVAIASRLSLEDVHMGLDGLGDDKQARYIEALVGGRLRVGCLYAPNGNPVSDTMKYSYKLSWMRRLLEHASARLRDEPDLPMVLGGDYNVCPSDEDVYNPASFADDALCRPETRAHYRSFAHMGFTDALRVRYPVETVYTFWDYKHGAWPKNHGLRIDHLLLNPAAADLLLDAGVDCSLRGEPKASDHTPVWVSLDV